MKYFEPHLRLEEISDSTPGHSFLPRKIGPYTISVLFLLLFLNSLILDGYFLLSMQKKEVPKPALSQNQQSSPTESQVATQAAPDICPNACTNQIDALKSTVSTLKQTSATQVFTTSSSKEYFVAFGGGTSSAEDWADVPGLTAGINSTAYESIKEVRFEASVYIPTGNETAYVRLFNKSDQHPVWFSEVSLSGGTPQLLISTPITLDAGQKTYQVQMKTSLKFQAVLSQARVHITTY